MPVTVGATLRRIAEAEFGKIAYDVMRHVFAVHNEFGRMFDEEVYQREIARRCGGEIEVPVDVSFGEFRKTYYLDLLVAEGAIFELKTVECLNDRHRSQLLHYLFLANMSHGKLINMDAESVQHEFVNTTLTLGERTAFAIDDRRWSAPGELRTSAERLLRDFGTGLDLALYRVALSHVPGGDELPPRRIPIVSDGVQVGFQSIHFAGEGLPLHWTALRNPDRACYADQLQRFLNRTPLPHLHWINVTHSLVTFTTLNNNHR